MKLFPKLFVVVFAIILCIPAVAQNKTVVGKWTVVGVNAEGMDIDLENPAKSKQQLAIQMQKETGAKADSASVEVAFATMASMIDGMTVEFTSKGKGIFFIPLPSGEIKSDTASYTVDYAKGVMNTSSMEGGVQVKDKLKIKFEGDYLTMINEEKNEAIKVKRIK
jgi:hypothetical protein